MDKQKLTELEPYFLKIIDPTHFDMRAKFEDCDGLGFLCPVCFVTNKGKVGTHTVFCWRPHVPQSIPPTPGRWEFQGTGMDDLTLVAGSSSILIMGGCNAHFYIRNGRIEF